MRIKGKSDIKKEDVLFYNFVASVASDLSKRIADELTPTFIVDEAIVYFDDREEYEICLIIKNFYDNNPSFFIDSSRSEWFGTANFFKKK